MINDSSYIQQSILTISENNISVQKIKKNENKSDNFFINVAQVLDDHNLILFMKPYVHKFQNLLKIIPPEK